MGRARIPRRGRRFERDWIYRVPRAHVLAARGRAHAGLRAERRRPNETFGWDRITSSIRRSAESLGQGTVVAGNHNVLCGHLEYALDDSPNVYCASEHRTQFDFVGRRAIPRSTPVVYVDSSRYPRDPTLALEGRACSLDRRVEIERGGRVVQNVRVWSCPADYERGREQQANR